LWVPDPDSVINSEIGIPTGPRIPAPGQRAPESAILRFSRRVPPSFAARSQLPAAYDIPSPTWPDTAGMFLGLDAVIENESEKTVKDP
jgi:hypothetical protein